MIDENKVIELAINFGSESDNKHNDRTTYEFDKKSLMQFFNALHDEFIKSLGEPIVAITVNGFCEHHTKVIYRDKPPHSWQALKRGIELKLYALPNDEKT